MKIVIYFFLITLILCSNLLSQNDTSKPGIEISIIFADVFFIEDVVSKSNYIYVPRSKYAMPAVTYYKSSLYLLKFSIKKESEKHAALPLDIKLTSPNYVVKSIKMEEDISRLKPYEIYNYEIEIRLPETGWYKFEIGKYNNDDSSKITYDKEMIFVRK